MLLYRLIQNFRQYFKLLCWSSSTHTSKLKHDLSLICMESRDLQPDEKDHQCTCKSAPRNMYTVYAIWSQNSSCNCDFTEEFVPLVFFHPETKLFSTCKVCSVPSSNPICKRRLNIGHIILHNARSHEPGMTMCLPTTMRIAGTVFFYRNRFPSLGTEEWKIIQKNRRRHITDGSYHLA